MIMRSQASRKKQTVSPRRFINMKVYIVFRQTREYHFSGNEFIGVFFDRTSAEVFINERPIPEIYFIESYEKPEEGKSHEVFA